MDTCPGQELRKLMGDLLVKEGMTYYTVYWTRREGQGRGDLNFLTYGDALKHAKELEGSGCTEVSIYVCRRVYENDQNILRGSE